MVLFDLDGTLTDAAPGIVNGMRIVFDRFDIEQPDDATMRTYLGPPLAVTWPMSLLTVFVIRMRLLLFKRELTSRSFRKPWDIPTSASHGIPTAGCSETTWTPLRPAWMRRRLSGCQTQMVPKWFLWPSPSTFKSTPTIAEPPIFTGGSRWSRLGDLNPGPTHYECERNAQEHP